MRREYKSGTRWCVWRWKDIYWNGRLYLRRLHIVQTPWFSVLLHFIKTADTARHLHDHPVSMLSIFLKGAYMERTFFGTKVKYLFNWIPTDKAHTIRDISPGGVVTLCFCGPRRREWGFYTASGWIHWKEYLKLYGGEA